MSRPVRQSPLIIEAEKRAAAARGETYVASSAPSIKIAGGAIVCATSDTARLEVDENRETEVLVLPSGKSVNTFGLRARQIMDVLKSESVKFVDVKFKNHDPDASSYTIDPGKQTVMQFIRDYASVE